MTVTVYERTVSITSTMSTTFMETSVLRTDSLECEL